MINFARANSSQLGNIIVDIRGITTLKISDTLVLIVLHKESQIQMQGQISHLLELLTKRICGRIIC